MQDIKPIRVFLEVAAQSSFAGAARHLNMTPASVTRIVAKLEGELGQQLLLRTTRQVSLTSAGALVVSRYRPIMEELDRVTQEVTRETAPDRGELAINVPMSFGLRLLAPVVQDFQKTYPRISLTVNLTDTLVDIIAENCDLAIRVSGPPSDKSTIWRKVCEVPRYAVASPDFVERMGRINGPEDLKADTCLSYASDGRPETWEFRNGAIRRSVRAGKVTVSNNGDFLYALATAGAGIAVLPNFIVDPGLASGEVVRVLPDWTLPSLWLTVYYPPYEKLPPLVATFTTFFEDRIRRIEGMGFAD